MPPAAEPSWPSAGGLLGGRLLVATPQLEDPNFTRTVVLILEHDEPGAVGVVLNRPLRVEVAEILDPWEELAAEAPPSVVFSGGPVSPDAVIGLAQAVSSEVSGEWKSVVGGVGVVDLSVSPVDQPVVLRSARLFSGYAGWGPGQLESEVADGGWFVIDAVAGDVMADQPQRLWHDVLHRQPGRLAMLASYPPAPSVN
ncbi:MAG TPA: YqgE/AlgH family protein [Acidimicrobiales bacterium]|nr:YqgE/AlgH family protein [Acidimicrobiales bacterium]